MKDINRIRREKIIEKYKKDLTKEEFKHFEWQIPKKDAEIEMVYKSLFESNQNDGTTL